MSFADAEFSTGHWDWNYFEEKIDFISHKKVVDVGPQSVLTVFKPSAGCTHADLDLKFRDTSDALEHIKFRRKYRRQIRSSEIDIVTMRDIKDVVMFQVASKLPPEFIDLFHTQGSDRFCRALIFYFQLYLQMSDELSERHAKSLRTLRVPNTDNVENKLRDNLADLRAMVGREYCCFLLGAGGLHKYHHMANKLHTSAPERDIRFFELLYQVSVRVVWIALNRRSLNKIELELNRLFRTDAFNLVARLKSYKEKSAMEIRVLNGVNCEEEFKLLTRSPAALEIIKQDHDYRILGTGFVDFDSKDSRVQYLEAAYSAPEELLSNFCVTVGILGLPRNDFDTMLVPIQTPEETGSSNFSYTKSAISSASHISKDKKPYKEVYIPDFDEHFEVPSHFPKKKGIFPANVHHHDIEDGRLMWRAYRTYTKL